MSTDNLKTCERQFNALKRKFTRGYSMREGLAEFHARRKAALAEMELLLEQVIELGDTAHMLQKAIRQFLSQHRKQASIDWLTELSIEQPLKADPCREQDRKPDSSPSFVDWINARENETHFPSSALPDDRLVQHPPIAIKLPKTAAAKR
jgi:hypothetical protein